MSTKSFTIIPAIDLIEGKAVRLTRGDYAQKKIYNADPVEQAKAFADAGLKRLHLVDLDGAKAGKMANLKVLERIAAGVDLEIDFGGGVNHIQDIRDVFNAGAMMVAIGSVAVKNPELFFTWVREIGGDAIFLGADVREGLLAVKGWTEMTDISIEDFLEKQIAAGIKNIFCTDISRDGMLAGPSVELYTSLIKHFPEMQLTASGGVSNLEDLDLLKESGCIGVIIGKAIYEGRITLSDLKNYSES